MAGHSRAFPFAPAKGLFPPQVRSNKLAAEAIGAEVARGAGGC